jgi:hypothetical protein
VLLVEEAAEQRKHLACERLQLLLEKGVHHELRRFQITTLQLEVAVVQPWEVYLWVNKT